MPNKFIENGKVYHIFGSQESKEYYPSIHEYEISYFGPDFRCSYQDILPWIRSNELFYSIIINDSKKSFEIVSLISFFIASEKSINDLLDHKIKEHELKAYNFSMTNDSAVLYFSSLIAKNPSHVLRLYRRIMLDFISFKKANKIILNRCISIASTDFGRDHLKNSGFHEFNNKKYLNKYPILELKYLNPSMILWAKLLDVS